MLDSELPLHLRDGDRASRRFRKFVILDDFKKRKKAHRKPVRLSNIPVQKVDQPAGAASTLATQLWQYPLAVTGPGNSWQPPHLAPASGALYNWQPVQTLDGSVETSTYLKLVRIKVSDCDTPERSLHGSLSPQP